MIKQHDTYVHDIRFNQPNVATFAQITGDNNPIHLDADFAAKTIFGKPIVHDFIPHRCFRWFSEQNFPAREPFICIKT